MGDSTYWELCDWQSKEMSSKDRLRALREHQCFTDVIIRTSDKVLRAHSLFLVLHSKVFEAIFHGSFYAQRHRDYEIEVGTPSDVVEWVLDFIYNDIKSISNLSKVKLIYAFAHEWQFDLVLAKCSMHICDQIDETNVVDYYNFAVLYEDKNLKDVCKKVLCDQFKFLFIGLENLNMSSMSDLLTYEDLGVAEVDIFKGVYLWSMAKVNSGKSKQTPQNLRELLKGVVPLLRFLTMDINDFVNVVMPTGILTSDESVLIMKRLLGKDVALPSTLCTSTKKRTVKNTLRTAFSVFVWKCTSVCRPLENRHLSKLINYYKLASFTLSGYILLGSISATDFCFEGFWQCYIEEKGGKVLGCSFGSGPPWKFRESLTLSPSKDYLAILRGKGMISHHPYAKFRTTAHGLDVQGRSVMCNLILNFTTL